jgi:hypothetical protein
MGHSYPLVRADRGYGRERSHVNPTTFNPRFRYCGAIPLMCGIDATAVENWAAGVVQVLCAAAEQF